MDEWGRIAQLACVKTVRGTRRRLWDRRVDFTMRIRHSMQRRRRR